MPTMLSHVRQKRFELKKSSPVKLLIETALGERLTLQVVNCSVRGVGAICETFTEHPLFLDSGDLVSAAKIFWEGYEYYLGRMVVKVLDDKAASFKLGFLLIDTVFPIDGPISKYLDQEISKDHDPFKYEIDADHFNISNFIQMDGNNIDIFGKCQEFSIFMDTWKKGTIFSYDSVRKAGLGLRLNLKAKRSNGRNDYIMMGSSDYLGLADHPKVIEDACKAIKEYGYGPTGTPVLSGTTDIHEELCEYLAKIYRKEKVLLFNSGYAANYGALSGIISYNDLIIADTLAHASLHDGMTKSQGNFKLYKHNDTNHLREVLEKYRSESFGSLIVTEGVFSMDGDIAPLREIVKIAKETNSRTYVDEIHSMGILGENGLGACEREHVIEDIDIIMGGFSKTLGSMGGFICSTKAVCDWLTVFARSRLFSAALPPSAAKASLTALKLMFEERYGAQELHRNIKHFIQGMRNLGAPLSEHHESAIIPVVVPDLKKLGKMNHTLREMGIWVYPSVFPVVSRNSPRFRFIVSASHSLSDLDYVIASFERAMEKADFKFEIKK